MKRLKINMLIIIEFTLAVAIFPVLGLAAFDPGEGGGGGPSIYANNYELGTHGEYYSGSLSNTHSDNGVYLSITAEYSSNNEWVYFYKAIIEFGFPYSPYAEGSITIDSIADEGGGPFGGYSIHITIYYLGGGSKTQQIDTGYRIINFGAEKDVESVEIYYVVANPVNLDPLIQVDFLRAI